LFGDGTILPVCGNHKIDHELVAERNRRRRELEKQLHAANRRSRAADAEVRAIEVALERLGR